MGRRVGLKVVLSSYFFLWGGGGEGLLHSPLYT